MNRRTDQGRRDERGGLREIVLRNLTGRRLWRAGFSVALSLGLLALVLKYLNPGELIRAIARPNWVWLAAMMATLVVYQALRAARFAALMPESGSRWHLFETMCTQCFLNWMLPFALGDVSMIYLLQSRHQLRLHHGTAVVIVVRVIDVAVLGLIYLLTAFYAWSVLPSPSYWVIGGLLAAAVVGALALGIVVRFEHSGVASRIPMLARIYHHLAQFRLALRLILSEGRLPGAVLYSAAMRIAILFFFYASIRALNFPMGLLTAMLLSILTDIVALPPVKGVAGIGTHQASWFVALQLLHQNPESAALLGVGTHLLYTLCFTLVAVIPVVSAGVRAMLLRFASSASATRPPSAP